jgi:hypothetical protein
VAHWPHPRHHHPLRFPFPRAPQAATAQRSTWSDAGRSAPLHPGVVRSRTYPRAPKTHHCERRCGRERWVDLGWDPG